MVLSVANRHIKFDLPPADERRLRERWSESAFQTHGARSESTLVIRRTLHGWVLADSTQTLLGPFSCPPALDDHVVNRLLMLALRWYEPSLQFFHANVLLSPESDRLLLLAGRSRSGKSTLSAEAHEAGWRILGEDIFCHSPREARVLPWRRNASWRDQIGERPLDWHRRASDAPPLAALEIACCLLQFPADHEEGPQRFILSGWDDRLRSEVSAAADANPRIDDAAELPAIAFAEPLPQERITRLAQLLTAQGIEILAIERAGPSSPRRPPRPELQHLSTIDGIVRLLAEEVLAPADTAPSHRVMQAARTMPHARFLHVVPGGHPADTFKAILSAAGWR